MIDAYIAAAYALFTFWVGYAVGRTDRKKKRGGRLVIKLDKSWAVDR